METIAMTPTSILSATLIDLVFDGRNKAYGAYELRKTYSKRVVTALISTMLLVTVVIGSTALGYRSNEQVASADSRDSVVLHFVDEIPRDKLPEPERQPEPEPVRTAKFVAPLIVPDIEFNEPMTANEDLDSMMIGTENIDGPAYQGTATAPELPGQGKAIVPEIVPVVPDVPLKTVDVQAKFTGEWVKFLLRNLRGDVPVNEGAGPGRYSVIIQFVVDKEGKVSEIKALTAHGYGMEEEAIRVLRKAARWEPAMQNGQKVKAYHRQVITFDILDE
jgi:protein TonB